MAKAVVIRLSSLGDIVLTTPVLDGLRAHGYDEIVYVTKAPFAPLFAADRRVTKLLLLGEPSPTGRAAAGNKPVEYAKNWLQLAWLIRAQQADTVLDLHAVLRTYLMSAVGMGWPRRYRKGALTRRFAMRTRRWPPQPLHVIERYLYALDEQGVRSEIPRPRLYSDPSARADVEQLLKGSRALKVGLVPGAQWATKQWPIEKFVELAKTHTRHGATVVWLGGKKEAELKTAIAGAGEGAIDLIDQTTLPQLVAAIEACDILVANDTGAMHIATAVSTPVVGIFGPTSRELGFWPTGPRDRTAEVTGLECRPCSLHGDDRCPLGHHLCMKSLAVEAVQAEVEALL